MAMNVNGHSMKAAYYMVTIRSLSANNTHGASSLLVNGTRHSDTPLWLFQQVCRLQLNASTCTCMLQQACIMRASVHANINVYGNIIV